MSRLLLLVLAVCSILQTASSQKATTDTCYWTCFKQGKGFVSWGPLRFGNSEAVKGEAFVSWGPLRFGPSEALSSTAVSFILFGIIGYAVYWYGNRAKSAGKASSNSDDKLPSPLKVSSSSRGTPVAVPSSSSSAPTTNQNNKSGRKPSAGKVRKPTSDTPIPTPSAPASTSKSPKFATGHTPNRFGAFRSPDGKRSRRVAAKDV